MSYLSDLLGDNYHEGMTEEEISTALESAKVGVSNGNEINNLRAALSKANGEAADYKRQLRSRQTAEEAAAAEQKSLMEQLTQENTSLKRTISISEQTTKLMGLGYAADLASATATALIDGDLETVIKNQATFLDAQKESILADRMKNTPRPAAGAAGGAGHYKQLIEEAQAHGDISTAAYYTRLMQTETST